MSLGLIKKIIFIFAIVFVSLVLNPIQSFSKTASPQQAEINLCFGIDNNYPDHLLVTLFSIFHNNESNSHFNIFVIENDLSKYNKYRIEKFVNKNSHNVEFVKPNLNLFNNGNIYSNFLPHVTKITFARLLIPSLLPKDIDKVLYLDSDILVLSDIKELYDTDISGYLAGMIKDLVVPTYPNLYIGVHYNAGVILIDLKGWRKENVQQKMTNFLNANVENFFSQNLVYKLADQDIINIVLNKRIKTISSSWNTLYWDEPSCQWGREPELVYPVKLIHFIGPEKPWKSSVEDPFFYTYDIYWKRSPFVFTRLKYLFLMNHNAFWLKNKS